MDISRPFQSISALHEERLECLRITWHRELGVAAALLYCAEYKLNPPRWAIEEAVGVLCRLLKHEKSSKRGRASGTLARYRQDMIDFTRWDAVREVRRQQVEIRQEVEELRAIQNVPQGVLKEREKMLFWVGRNWLRAYECAAMILAGTESSAGPEAMKASYLRVQQNSRDPRQALRYHMLDPVLTRGLGIDAERTVTRGRKVVPLYELVL